MEQLIPLVNKLQDVLLATDTPLDLPQIVVVGSQSSGKSSVLENIVGRDFLPRGSGIVTRRPLVLQMINLPWDESTSSDVIQEWGEFLHLPEEKFFNFDKIRKEIEKDTDNIAGKNKGICDAPISLRIYSPFVLNLTLVDLPGITRVPVGDQPPDIERQIRRMVLKYISKENAIILAVSPANTDIANSDALQLAQEVDPDGERTIGVLTKLDLMDLGTDAMEVLQGHVVPLRLGFVGVVNRSQHDINKRKSIRQALRSEKEFFENHPIYAAIASRCGTPYLTTLLNRTLVRHIKDVLPDLRKRINTLLAHFQQDLSRLSASPFSSKGSQGALLLQLLTSVSTHFIDVIDGKRPCFGSHELNGGARIAHIFHDIFGQGLDTLDPMEGLTMQDIRTTLKNSTGPRPALFIPEACFELLVKRQIGMLEEPALQCAEMVLEELLRIISQIEQSSISHFPHLLAGVQELAASLIRDRLKPTHQMISSLIQMEMAYINTNHPDFVSGSFAVSQVMARVAQKENASPNPQHSHPSTAARTPVQGTYSHAESDSRGGHKQHVSFQAQNNHHSSTAGASVASSSGHRTAEQGPKDGGDEHLEEEEASTGGFMSYFFKGNRTPKRSRPGLRRVSVRQPQPQPTPAPSAKAPGPDAQAGIGPLHQASAQTAGLDAMSTYIHLEQIPDNLCASPAHNDKELMEIELIKSLLESYFNIVRKHIQDAVPKAVMHLMVNHVRDELQNALVGALYKEDLFEDLLQEDPILMQKRKTLEMQVGALKKAATALMEIREAGSTF
eukprot:GCRY01002113.1.p1 GENE.GCRY01002113.1~~GCRY01002113.1.p1  ORF type:complete len:785 (-),score=217.21 GCRY01002113.1:1050-3404(-)